MEKSTSLEVESILTNKQAQFIKSQKSRVISCPAFFIPWTFDVYTSKVVNHP